jgi:hypothetical protein
MLDWAAESARAPAEIKLRVHYASDQVNDAGIVVFSVSRSPSLSSTSNLQPVDSACAEDQAEFDARADLALATAEDAASALGGNLDFPEGSAGQSVIRIRLPQPSRG